MSQYSLPIFPFSAIVGQDQMKLALVLNAIDPQIGGVLIRGEKGTAKSTAVRALARLLPAADVVRGCAFHCDPRDRSAMCENCRQKAAANTALPVEKTPFRVVNVPLGITEDRLLGTLSIENVLKDGTKHFEPGILAAANRGILYIDEVNLLDDHLVDELLDVAAMGVNLVEREGISYSHPSRFILVGTMNPEEGELRPQLLDRFGLCVDVETIREQAQRKEIIKRRIAYERAPAAFLKAWQKDDRAVGKAIGAARSLVSRVKDEDWAFELISRICILADVDGHRADTCILKAGKAFAAWSGRTTVTAADFTTAAGLVLPHRLKKKPFDDERKIEDLHGNMLAIVREYEEREAAHAHTTVELREKKSLRG